MVGRWNGNRADAAARANLGGRVIIPRRRAAQRGPAPATRPDPERLLLSTRSSTATTANGTGHRIKPLT